MLHGVAPGVLHCVDACLHVSEHAPWCCTVLNDACRLMLHCVAHLSTPVL